MGDKEDKTAAEPRPLKLESIDDQLGEEIDERLRSVKSPAERRTLAGLLREIANLPLEHTRAALEISAAIAGVSLRASIEFLRAVPGAAQVLEAAELRAWGEVRCRANVLPSYGVPGWSSPRFAQELRKKK